MSRIEQSDSNDVCQVLKVKSLLNLVYFVLKAILDEYLVFLEGGVAGVRHFEEAFISREPNVVDNG